MTPRMKRRLIDCLIGFVMVVPIYVWAGIWAGVLATAHGLWCFYDGITRMDLADE